MAAWLAGGLIGGLIAGLVAFAAYVRLAPSDPARWHVGPDSGWYQDLPWNEVAPVTGGAILRLSVTQGVSSDWLARLDAVALATPRTARLAGSVEAGRITWITRSALWGFPDYTTVELREEGLYIYARLRFGRDDRGVNAARLRDWLARLEN